MTNRDYLEQWRDLYSYPNYITDNQYLTESGKASLDNENDWNVSQEKLVLGSAVGTAANFYLDPNPLFNKVGDIYSSIITKVFGNTSIDSFISARTDAIKMNLRNMDYTNGKNSIEIESQPPLEFFCFYEDVETAEQIFKKENALRLSADLAKINGISEKDAEGNKIIFYRYSDFCKKVVFWGEKWAIHLDELVEYIKENNLLPGTTGSDNSESYKSLITDNIYIQDEEGNLKHYIIPSIRMSALLSRIVSKMLGTQTGLQLLMPQYHRRVEVEDLNKNFWVISLLLDAVVNALWGPYGLIDVVRQLILKVEQMKEFLGLDGIKNIELLHYGNNDLYFDMYSRFTLPGLQLKLITDSGERIIKDIFRGHSKNVDRRTINGETTTNGSVSVPELFEEITEEMYNTSYFNNTDEGIVELWGANNQNFTGLFDSDLVRSIKAFNVSSENANEEYKDWTGDTYASLSSVIDAINNKIVGDKNSFTGYTYDKRQRDRDFFEILDPKIGDGRLTTKEYSILEQDINTDFSEVVLIPDQIERFKKYNESYNYLKKFDTTPEEISSTDTDIIGSYYTDEEENKKYCPTNFEGKDLKDLYSEVYSIVPYMEGVDDYKEFLNGQLDDIYNHLEVTYNAHKKQNKEGIAEIKTNNDGKNIFEIYETLGSQYDNIRRMGKLENLDNPKFYTVLYVPEQHLYDKDVLIAEGILNKETFNTPVPTFNKLIGTEVKAIDALYSPFEKPEDAIAYHLTISSLSVNAEIDLGTFPITTPDEKTDKYVVPGSAYRLILNAFARNFGIPFDIVQKFSPDHSGFSSDTIEGLKQDILEAILSKTPEEETKSFNEGIKEQLLEIGINEPESKQIKITYGSEVTTTKTFFSSVRYAAKIAKTTIGENVTTGDITDQLFNLFNMGVNKNTGIQDKYNDKLNEFLGDFQRVFNNISIDIPFEDSVLTLKTPERIFIINEERVSNAMRDNIEEIIIDDITSGLENLTPEDKKKLVAKCVLPAIYDLPFKIHHLESLQMIENDRIPLYGATVTSLLASDLAKKSDSDKQTMKNYKFTNGDNAVDFFFDIAESDKSSIDVRDCAAIARFAKTGGNYEYWEKMIEIEKYIDDNYGSNNPPIQINGVGIFLEDFFKAFGVPETVDSKDKLKNYLFTYIDNPQKNLTALAKYYIPTNQFLNLLQEIDDSQKEGVDWSLEYQKQALLNSVKEQEYGIYDNILIYLFDQDYYSLKADYTGSDNENYHFPSLYVRNTDMFFSDVSNPLIPGRTFLNSNTNNSYTIPLFVPRKDLIGGEIIEMRLSGNYNNRKRLDFDAAVNYMLRREGQDVPKLIDGSRLTFKFYNSFADNLGQYNYRTALFFKDTSEAFEHTDEFKITSINDIFMQGIQTTYFKPSLYKEFNKKTAVTKAQLLPKDLKLCASMIASNSEYIDNSYELTVGLNNTLPMSDPDDDNYANSVGPKPKSCYLFERKQAYCSAVRNNLIFYSSPSTNEHGQFIHSPLLALTSPNKFTPSTTIQTAEINSKGITSLANENDRVKKIPYDVMGKTGDKCTLVGIKDMLYRNAYEQIPPTIELCWGRRDVNDYIKTKKLKYIVIEREKGDRHKYYAPTCAGISISEGFLHDYNCKGLTSAFESAHYNHPIVWYDENGKNLGYYDNLDSKATSYPCPSRAVYGVIDLSKSNIDISKGSTFLVRFYNSNPAVFEKNKSKCEPWTREEFTYYNPNSGDDKTLITRRPIIQRVYFLGESNLGIQRSNN